MLVFSGAPNPEWSISRDNQETYDDVRNLFSDAVENKEVYNPSLTRSSLGFNGFLLQAGDEGPSFYIVGQETSGLQVKLFESRPKDLIEKETADYISQELGKKGGQIVNEKFESTTKRAVVPALDVLVGLLWNYEYTRIRNNCYNYAVNVITNTFAQPGRSRKMFNLEKPLTSDIVRNAAEVDGLEVPAIAAGSPMRTFIEAVPRNHYLLALAVHRS